MSFFILSPPESSIAILTAESVLASPSLASSPPRHHHARSPASYDDDDSSEEELQQLKAKGGVVGLRSLVSRAKERSKRRESFGPVERRGLGGLESVLEDSETEEDGIKVVGEGIQVAPASTPSRPQIFRRNSPTAVARLTSSSLKSPVRAVPTERRVSLPLTPPESLVDVFAFGVPTTTPIRPVPSVFPPSFSSSSVSSSSEDSDSNSSADEACTTPTSCSSFGYQQSLSPSKSAAYFDQPTPKQKSVLPGSQNVARGSVVAPSVGSGLSTLKRATEPRSSLPLPKNDYALKAGMKQQTLDLILPSLAVRKPSTSPTAVAAVQKPAGRRVSAPLPTLSQISARLQPVRRSTAPAAVPTVKTTVVAAETEGGSRLPPFLLARRRREEAAKAAAAAVEISSGSEEEEIVEQPLLRIPIPTFTVTPPPERADEGRKVRELLVGRLSTRV